ncbi:hypothetical protein CBU02nite_13940 [Clostridium butyricum]|uniref:O-antigen ligase-related domain-containing protein n=1 Tax=Clostridium butyricum TaxID=1492 RepID=A0A512TLL1_CLOBU|nr:O-antigen ligase family protein [Clostridium butyricum]NOW24201.1 hypothetical protein [Clostridium butyricum]GEQ20888.1 hypothetical protein CBU02nite_13940 [Clostridium butyricum]
MLSKTKIENFLDYIIAICLILNVHSVWNNTIIRKLNVIFLIISLLIYMFMSINNLKRKKREFIKASVITLTVIVYNLLFITINLSSIGDFILNFIILYSLFIYYSIYKRNIGESCYLLLKISNLIFIISIVSLFFYIFGSVLKVVSANSDILLRWGTDRYVSSYHNLYYETQTINIFGKQIIRNTGIFTEAPMYAFNLCISLSVEVFIRKKQKNKKIIVLLFTILTTFSTTGIVVSLLIISINLINSRKNYGLLKKMCLYLFVMILMISSMFFINYKVIQSKDIYGSYSIRMDDIKVGIEAWKDNIIMGKGYNRYDLVQQYMSINDRGNDIGGSNGIMKILPEGGIYLLSIYIFPLVIALVYSIKYRVKNVIIFETILVILLININVPYRFIMIYFLSLGLSYLFKNDSSKIGENYEKI